MVWEFLVLASVLFVVYTTYNRSKKQDVIQKMIELQFIIASTELLQLKYHTIQIAEIVYQKAIEEDETKREEFQRVKQKIEEKFDERGNYYINKLQMVLGKKFVHKSWKDAIKFAEAKIKNVQDRRDADI